MGERPRNVLAGHELFDAVKAPTGCQVWVLVEEVQVVVDLVLIHLGAELDIPPCLLHPFLEIDHPHMVILVHELVKLLQLREQCTGWRPDHHGRLVALNGLPASAPVLLAVEVVPTLNVHRHSKPKAELFGHSNNSLGTEDFGDVRTHEHHGFRALSSNRNVNARVRVDLMDAPA